MARLASREALCKKMPREVGEEVALVDEENPEKVWLRGKLIAPTKAGDGIVNVQLIKRAGDTYWQGTRGQGFKVGMTLHWYWTRNARWVRRVK